MDHIGLKLDQKVLKIDCKGLEIVLCSKITCLLAAFFSPSELGVQVGFTEKIRTVVFKRLPNYPRFSFQGLVVIESSNMMECVSNIWDSLNVMPKLELQRYLHDEEMNITIIAILL